jgi:hypothetical protein
MSTSLSLSLAIFLLAWEASFPKIRVRISSIFFHLLSPSPESQQPLHPTHETIILIQVHKGNIFTKNPS